MIASDHEVVFHGDLASRHQHDVARGAADLHRDEIASVLWSDARPIDRMAVVVQCADCGGWSAEQQIDRPGRDLINRDDTAIGLHQQERPAEAKLPKLDVQVAQVGDNGGCERGVYDSGRRALVLAHHRARARPRSLPMHRCGGAAHVPRPRSSCLSFRKLLKKRDRDRFHVFGFEGGQRGVDIPSNERRVLAAIRVDATANAISQVTWDQHGGKGLAMVPLILPEAASDLERVAKSLGREKTNLGAFTFEHAVGRDRRTVNEEGAVPEYIVDRAVEIVCKTLECSKNALARVRRYRGHFDDAD